MNNSYQGIQIPESRVARLVINKTSNNYTFQLVGSGRQYLLTSVPFRSALDCIMSMMELKRISSQPECFTEISDAQGLHYFRVKDTHGKLLAISSIYESEESRRFHLHLARCELNLAELVDE